MTMEKMNDAPVLDQISENYGKFLALVVWKLAPNGVTITMDDIQRFAAEGGMFFAHGHRESFDFKIVTPEQAEVIAAHERATNRGNA